MIYNSGVIQCLALPTEIHRSNAMYMILLLQPNPCLEYYVSLKGRRVLWRNDQSHNKDKMNAFLLVL